jgi:membrane associated rhomboid family serine protease
MGESDRYVEYKGRKISFGDDSNALIILVALNGIFFVGLGLITLLFSIIQSPGITTHANIPYFFKLSASLQDLYHQPWTILTHMFTHTGFLFLVTNMLWLWAFGYIFQRIAGNSRLIPMYLYAGLVAAVSFIGIHYAIPSLRPFIETASLDSASPAIMGIAIASTTLAPDHRFFKRLNGGIPLWVLTIIYVFIDISSVAGVGLAYSISHIMGGLTGFFFVFSMQRGVDWSHWMNDVYHWFMNLFNPAKKTSPQKRIREKVFYNTGGQKPFSRKPRITQDRVDEILDKINQKGYQALTDDEKDILKRAGDSNDLTT